MPSKLFSDLRKLSPHPAARLLSVAGFKLDTQVRLPASAAVPAVLEELHGHAAWLDMMKLLAVALPGREATWWACLAARDLLPEGAPVPPPLAAAEAWVFKPTEENRRAVQLAYEGADMDDTSVFCAMCALYAEGSLGTGDLAELEAPPAAVPAGAMSMNVFSLETDPDAIEANAQKLIARALDIARGGSGKVTGDAAKLPLAEPEGEA